MEFNPFANLRNSLQNVQAHPFQSLVRGFAGAVNPGLGFAAGRGFDAYNARQFNNAADAANERMAEQGNRAAQGAMDKPLKGPLGQYNDNSALASALSGRQADGGWNMSQAFGPQQSNWSQSGNPGGLLSFLGQPNAGGPNLGGLDQAIAAANGGSTPRSNGGMSGGGFGNFSGGNNWGGGFGGSMMSNLGMASGVQGFGGFGGSPTGMNNLDVNWLPG